MKVNLLAFNVDLFPLEGAKNKQHMTKESSSGAPRWC